MPAPSGVAANASRAATGSRPASGPRAPRLASTVFFFASRRRHTRLQGDWSSRRVLFRSKGKVVVAAAAGAAVAAGAAIALGGGSGGMSLANARFATAAIVCPNDSDALPISYSVLADKIGRASCRQREYQAGGVGRRWQRR